MIVLDDCQWADEATLDLITTWAREAGGGGGPRHAILIATYRPERLSGDHPLRQLAAVRRIGLGPLEHPARRVGFAELSVDVRKLLGAAAILGREFDPVLAGTLLGRGETWQALTAADAVRRGALSSRARPGGRRSSSPTTSSTARRSSRCRSASGAASTGGRPTRWRRRPATTSTRSPSRRSPPVTRSARSGGRWRPVGRRSAGERPTSASGTSAKPTGTAAHGAPELELEVAESLAAAQLARGRTDLAADQLGEAARIAREPGRRAAITATLAGIEAERG